MKEIHITDPLVVPACWRDLLAIEDFDALPDYVMSYRGVDGPGHAADPTPYVDDVREISIEQDGYRVTVGLCSNQSNYWVATVAARVSDGLFVSDEEGIGYDVAEGAEDVWCEDGELLVRYRVEVHS